MQAIICILLHRKYWVHHMEGLFACSSTCRMCGHHWRY